MTVISATASGEVEQTLLPQELAYGGDVLTGGTSFLDHRQEFVEIRAGARVDVDDGEGRSRGPGGRQGRVEAGRAVPHVDVDRRAVVRRGARCLRGAETYRERTPAPRFLPSVPG